MLASSPPWPAVLLGVAAVVAVCLWLLFRPGSMADRATVDYADDDPGAADADRPGELPADDPAQPSEGGGD
jgi:hypothetical protein